jgi:hypothetical protein
MEQNLLLLVILLLGVGVIALVLITLRRLRGPEPGHINKVTGYQRPRADQPSWFWGGALAVSLILLFAWADDRDTAIARIEHDRARLAAGYLPPHHARLVVDLNACPPRSDGMTDQVVMVIATQRDGGHVVHGCSRIAERQYMRRGGVKG